MGIRLDRAGEDHPAAADQQAANQSARLDVVKLRVADEIHAQRDEILRDGADELSAEHILHLRANPHRGRVHVPQFGDEMAVGEDIRLRQALADVGQNTQPAPVARHGEDDGAAVRQRFGNRGDQRVHLRVARG